MKFTELVDSVSDIESKLSTLNDSQLNLLESMLASGTDIKFDIESRLDHLVAFVDNFDTTQADTIVESVDCGEVLKLVLNEADNNRDDMDAFLTESINAVGELDTIDNTIPASNGIPLLSVVTNVLSEMLGESTVEKIPVEMIFDIVADSQNLSMPDESTDYNLPQLVEAISTSLKDAITRGVIDRDTANYSGETLYEFLDDYHDTADLLTEMQQVTDEKLNESSNRDAARILRKARSATILVESKFEKCDPGDRTCMKNKARRAKTWFSKHDIAGPGGGPIENFSVDSLSGKLGSHVKGAVKQYTSTHGKPPLKDYIQYVLIPGILKRMRMKNKSMSAKSNVKKAGMK